MNRRGDWIDACYALSKSIVECRERLEHMREIECAIRSGSGEEVGSMGIEVEPWRAELPAECAPGLAALAREAIENMERRLMELENDLMQVKAGALDWYDDGERRIEYEQGVEAPCNLIT